MRKGRGGAVVRKSVSCSSTGAGLFWRHQPTLWLATLRRRGLWKWTVFLRIWLHHKVHLQVLSLLGSRANPSTHRSGAWVFLALRWRAITLLHLQEGGQDSSTTSCSDWVRSATAQTGVGEGGLLLTCTGVVLPSLAACNPSLSPSHSCSLPAASMSSCRGEYTANMAAASNPTRKSPLLLRLRLEKSEFTLSVEREPRRGMVLLLGCGRGS